MSIKLALNYSFLNNKYKGGAQQLHLKIFQPKFVKCFLDFCLTFEKDVNLLVNISTKKNVDHLYTPTVPKIMGLSYLKFAIIAYV